MWIFFGKWPFFRADMAGLVKYCMGGYGRIGVHRVKLSRVSITLKKKDLLTLNINNSIYIFVGESDRINWCNVASFHRVCHYTSTPLVMPKLNWR